MVLIFATRDFRERTKSKLVKIMIWAGIVVITFVIAVRIYPIFIFLLKERIKPLVEAFYDKLHCICIIYMSRFIIIYLNMNIKAKDSNELYISIEGVQHTQNKSGHFSFSFVSIYVIFKLLSTYFLFNISIYYLYFISFIIYSFLLFFILH
jgi:hypothetical protein